MALIPMEINSHRRMTSVTCHLCDPGDMGQQRSELAEYMNIKIAKDVDMIEFWKESRALLPQLFKVACRVLCVPASSSASESMFSTADITK